MWRFGPFLLKVVLIRKPDSGRLCTVKVQLLKRIGGGILTFAHQVTELSIPYISVCVLCPKWLLSPGATKRREKRHLFHKHKEPLWRHSSLFTFKHSFWCQLRSIEICLHWVLKKKVVQVAERTSPCLILLHCFMLQEGSGKQWEPTPRGREWMPKWSWCQPRLEKSFGSLCCYWCMCCCTSHRCLSFTIHTPHLVSDEMALLAFFRFIQY